MAEVKDMVKSNVVSQVPYFITFAYENAETKPQIKLTELFRYYNNQTTAIPLYGATNISATFNGKHADWNYKEIALTGAVTSTVKEAPVFSNEDEKLFEAGSYFEHAGTGEIVLVERVDTTNHIVYMRRALFNTKAIDFASGDKFFQLNTIEVAPDEVSAVQGVYTIEIATVAEGDKITIAGVETTLDSTSGASASAAVTAIKGKTFANYTVVGSGAILTFTEKSGKEGTGIPEATSTNTATTFTKATTTEGTKAGYKGGRGNIWANPLMGPSASGYYQA